MGGDASTRHGYPDEVVERIATALLATRRTSPRRPALIGVSGLQGSGKSTLAAQLAAALAKASVATVAMSLDDFYLGRAARARLARTVHPLLAARGVPGTHDLELVAATLAALRGASAVRPAWIPRFDKGRDTRMPRARWRVVRAAPQVILFEGWCIGAPAQPARALRVVQNELERSEDADGRWRTYVNARLQGDYAALWHSLDALVLLQAPSFDVVQRWRDEQEDALRRAHAPRAMSAAQLQRFVMHYERISRQALRALPARADLRIVLDDQRRVRRIVE